MQREARSGRQATLFAGMLLISTATLALEILQVRIFSYILWHHLAYLVITVALLGFGASGAFLSVVPSLLERDRAKLAGLLCLGFSLSTVISFFAATRLPVEEAFLGTHLRYFNVFLCYALMLTPYFFAGLTVALILTGEIRQVNKLYFVNLLGSGLGCFVVFAALNTLGAEKALLAVTILGALAGAVFVLGRGRILELVAIGCLLLLVVALPYAPSIIKTVPGTTKGLGTYLKDHPDLKWEYSRWDPIARIDVVSSPGISYSAFRTDVPHKVILQDGDAGTFLYNLPKDFEEAEELGTLIYASAYYVKEKPEVLIIGLGGALDVMTALHFDAKKITGVEINAKTIEIVRDVFAEFAGNPYQRDNVRIEHGEGRSFLRRSRDKYDIIQMTGVDTWTALTSGAYVLSENYLYTKEAFRNYMDHLRDDGVLAVMRWVFNPPREMQRLCTTGVSVLRDLGAQHPEDHFAIISDVPFATVLVKKTPFTEAEIESLRARVAESPWLELRYVPRAKGNDFFDMYFSAVKAGQDKEYAAGYVYDITPVSDDSPFFFEDYRWGMIFRTLLGLQSGYVLDITKGIEAREPIALYILAACIGQAAVLVLLFIVLPLAKFRREGLNTTGSGRWTLYFLCLGCGFMFVEIGLMQKLVLFLGSPIYSIAVTLAALLTFSGLGSLVAGKLPWQNRRVILSSICAIAVILIVYRLALDTVLNATLGATFGWRILTTVLLIAPLGLVMGMPFPTGLKMVEERARSFVPWALGINGGASVLSSILSIVVAMATGFYVVMMSACIIYLIGLAAIPPSSSRQ